ELGETPVVLSRGYGGELRGPVRVDPVRHAASDVGDEPLMLAGALPIVVSRKRAEGVPLARAHGATVILMDDGFQNPSIVKDASLIVIDSERGLGNGKVFPAGPLRAPLRPQLARTDALIIVGNGNAAASVAAEIESLIAEARRETLTLVTTEKDLARLRDWSQQIVPFPVTLEFDDPALLRKFVTDRLFKARERKTA